MLITCPECGKQISDKSDKCIHCGCPINSQNSSLYIINGKSYDFSKVLLDIDDDKISHAACVREISDICNIPIYDANQIYSSIKDDKLTKEFICNAKSEPTTPKCPTCGSTDIQKISATAKVAGAVTFGFFSKTARSQFKCKSCGYKW